MVKIEQLRVFLAVAERLHVTRAAQHLNLTQSAASAAIAALESGYGVRLFDRVGRRMVLTEAGRLLADQAAKVLAEAGEAERLLEDLSALKRGRLSIYASQTIANYWLPPMLAAFHARYPEIDLAVRIGNTQLVAEAIRTGATEIGFVEGDIDEPQMECVPVERDRLILVVAKSHPWNGRASIGRKDWTGTSWVLRERGSGTRQIFERALEAQGIDPARLRVDLELPSNESVRSGVAAGTGATVISQLAVEAHLKAGTLVQVGSPVAERQFIMIRHANRHLSKAEDAFIRLLAERGKGAAKRG